MNLQESITRIKEMMGLITEETQSPPESLINCTDTECKGTYKGLEFDNTGDIAHKFCNTMSNMVGKKLKELFQQKKYSKVDFNNIEMTTKDMDNKGDVTFYLKVPFIQVSEPCKAFTSFDHVGGWGHEPELQRRKGELSSLLISGFNFNVSDLKTTPEGLKEYWIQWKNKDYQSDCANKPHKVSSNSISNLREELRNYTIGKNLKIDEYSLDVNMDNYIVTFEDGETPLKSISLIFDKDEKTLRNRWDDIKLNKEPNIIKKDEGEKDGFFWILSIIKD